MTPEEERRVNKVTFALTGELRYRVWHCFQLGSIEESSIVVDTFNSNKTVWQGESHSLAETIAQNMNGLNIDD